MKRTPKVKRPKQPRPPGTGSAWRQVGLILLACGVAAGAGLLITMQFVTVFKGYSDLTFTFYMLFGIAAINLAFAGSLIRFRPRLGWLSYAAIGLALLIIPGLFLSNRYLDSTPLLAYNIAYTVPMPVAILCLLFFRRRRRDRTLVVISHYLAAISIVIFGAIFLYSETRQDSFSETTNPHLVDSLHISAILAATFILLTALFRALQKQTKVDTTQISDDETFDIPGCLICAGVGGDERMMRVEVWADDYWRLTASLVAEVPGFCYLEPRRHIEDITQLNGVEAENFGATVARITDALKETTGADQVYVYVFGGTIPHLHLHLAPHKTGDALNDDMVKGEKTIITLESGLELATSKEHPLLPEKELRTTAKRIQAELGG